MRIRYGGAAGQITTIGQDTNDAYRLLPLSSVSLSNVYHSLVPTDINVDFTKYLGQIVTIEGNSEVVNQLIANNAISQTISDVTVTKNNNGSYTLYGTATANIRLVVGTIFLTKGRNFLLTGVPNGATANGYRIFIDNIGNQLSDNIIQYNSSFTGNSDVKISIDSGTFVDFTIFVQVTDLTQMFPFDTPTSLDDPRVQKIINGGYIAYNTGTMRSVNIGTISSEPYNLFDGQLEVGTISQTTGQNESGSSTIRTINYIEVVSGKQYTLETTENYNAIRIFQYDSNKNLLSTSVGFVVANASINYILLNNTQYVRFVFAVSSVPSNPQVCFHRTSTRTGYAPHTAPQLLSLPAPVELSGVGTSKDTMQITDTNVVFTKNNVLLSNLSSKRWDPNGTSGFYTTDFEDIVKKGTTNFTISTSKYHKGTSSDWTDQNNIWVGSSGAIGIADYDFSGNSTDFKNYLANNNIQILSELATPQVITIPRKRLVAVDLGTLSWTYNSNGFFYATISDIKLLANDSVVLNAYCGLYLNVSYNGFNANMQMCQSYNSNLLRIKNSSYNDATTFKNAMSGTYLFYETSQDVADITDTLPIEAGGSINTDSDVLPNVSFTPNLIVL